MIIECPNCQIRNRLLSPLRKDGICRCYSCGQVIYDPRKESDHTSSFHGRINLPSILEDIHSAIDKELKTIERYGATSRITLLSGRKSTKAFARTNLYRFEMLIQRTLPDGSQGRLIVRNSSFDAKVVATEGQFIWLDLSQDLGHRIPHAYYDVDLSFLLKDLKEKYSSLIDNPNIISGPGINMIQGTIPENPIAEFSATDTAHYLSSEQLFAIENALSMEIGAIHGPPGTGKTRTLAGALVECFLAEDKLLVCGYTNRAVDEALGAFKKAATSCIPEQFISALKAGRILRKGVSVFPEKDPIIQSTEEATENLRSALQAELDSIRKKIRDTEEALKKLMRLEKELKKRERLRTELDRVLSEISTVSERFEKNCDVIRFLDNLIQGGEQAFADYQQSNFLKKVFTTRKRRKLLEEIQKYKDKKHEISSQQQLLIKRKAAFQIMREKLQKDLAEVEAKIAGQDTTDPKTRIRTLENQLHKLKMEAHYVEQTIDEASDKVINNALILFATLSRTHLDQDINKVKFDRVFIDEASIASLPQLFWAGSLAQRAIHIFGDPKQLAPICTSRNDEVRKWFARDVYHHAGLDDASSRAVATLRIQRRMNTEIGELVSALFYDNQLEHEVPDESEEIFGWMSSRKVAILDTANQGPFCNRHQSGRGFSRLNVVHAVIALNILKEAAEVGIESSTMAYIAPYRAQAEFFGALVLKNREVLKTDFLPDLRWGTVHRFQGAEANLVIYDTCESPRQLPTKLTGGSIKVDTEDTEIDDSTRLHCVACSRAKGNLIILANLKWLRESLAKDSTLSKLISRISKIGSVFPVPEQHSALKIFSKGMQRGLFAVDVENAPYILCDEGEFYKLLKDDLGTCTKNIQIVSPYLSERRLLSLEEHLRLLVSRNVKMTVWTKEPADLPTRFQQHNECADLLRQLGAKIVFRSGTHEKAVIIDEIISYYGSLNPLPHRNTRETMLRITDKAFAKTLFDHLDLEEDKKKEERFGFEETKESATERIFKRIRLKDIEGRLDKEKASKILRKLRWVIAEDKGLPYFSTLWNQTIEWLIAERPSDLYHLHSCNEFQKNKTNISGYEDIVLKIISMID